MDGQAWPKTHRSEVRYSMAHCLTHFICKLSAKMLCMDPMRYLVLQKALK